MSLRLRLSLVYTSLLGGVLLIFGILVYVIVSALLLGQIDTRLEQTSTQIIDKLRVNPDNQFDTRAFSTYQPTENLLFQVWDTNGNLQFSRPAGFRDPLNESGLHLGQSYYSSITINGGRVRVLSIPLRTSREPVGYLQVGLSMALVDLAQQTLASVLIILSIILMGLVAWSTWFLTKETLAQLSMATLVATRITQADDLSRRIPVTSMRNDEVGQLMLAFNDTLERLENLFNTQRRFLADVSHELRTPLTVIKGEVGLMRLTGSLDEESLTSIEKEVDRLTRLVGDLLLLEQAESGQLPLDMAPVELDTVLLEVFQQMSTLAGNRLKLILEDIDQVAVEGDRDRLKQVILNLIANAVEYTPPGGAVRVALRKTEQQAIFTVQDNGPGIPPEDLPHIFERFYRAERSRKRSGTSGFGLGLSIAHWIISRHQGEIAVQSELGKGTLFTVYLPLLLTPEEQQKSGQDGSGEAKPDRKTKVSRTGD